MNDTLLNNYVNYISRTSIAINADDVLPCAFGVSDIQRILPHREPFFKVSFIDAVNITAQTIEARYLVSTGDAVFDGHFPGNPVYPGVLQIEIMGQAGLCLAYFVKNNTLAIAANATPVHGLFTRVWNSAFIKPVLPGTELKIRVKVLEDDDILCVIGAQLFTADEALVAYSVLQLYYS